MSFIRFFIKRSSGFSAQQSSSASLKLYRIAITAVSLSVAVMILSVGVLNGFSEAIINKVIGFGSHIQVMGYNSDNSYESKPVELSEINLDKIKALHPEIMNINSFITKAGIAKANDDIEGLILKGVDEQFNWDFFGKNLIEGSIFRADSSDSKFEILVSANFARRMKLKPGDSFVVWFAQQPPRARKFQVCGIYSTGLEDFDERFALTSIYHLRKLNSWDNQQAGGLEVSLSRFRNIDAIAESINEELGYEWYAKTIRELQPQLFDWLKLQDMNVWVILVLMILVAVINMATLLLILIMENTQKIGILKAMGASGRSIRQVFILSATAIGIRGILIGNAVALGLAFLQMKTHFIGLDESSYYISYVPIKLEWTSLLLINLGTLLVCYLSLLLPAAYISRIAPVKALKMM
jgi:lipoprotein-releasing system permease protein